MVHRPRQPRRAVQGNAAASNDLIRFIATGCLKVFPSPQLDPAQFAGARRERRAAADRQPAVPRADPADVAKQVPPDPDRRILSTVEYKTEVGGSHGYRNVSAAERKASKNNATYYSFRPRKGIELISLDTVAEGGGQTGNLDNSQYRWLEKTLMAAQKADRLVIAYGHHTLATMSNTERRRGRPGSARRRSPAATPIEQEVNGVDDMLYINSQSTGDGRVSINVVFKPGTNIDQAQVLVQNRVSVAEPRLPEDVRRLGLVVRKASPDLMMVVHMVSPDDTRDQQYISNYATLFVKDRIARIDGVGDVRIFGARDYSMRVWLDPAKVAARDLTASEVVAALQAANLQVAAGSINQPPASSPGAFTLAVQHAGAADRAGRVREHRRPRRAGRVGHARARHRARGTGLAGLHGQRLPEQQGGDRPRHLPAAGFERAGDGRRRHAPTWKTLKKDFPPGVGYSVVYNPTEFIQFSIDAVIETLVEALILVVLVVIVFLQTWRAAIIPILAIPVSLIGTFSVMAALGISFNSLSLFGLVLAIGIVVDDAIVVVENVERYLQQGMTPLEAAHKTMDEVGGALLAISLVLIGVFLPTAFISGLQGTFYKQFAITIAASTAISCFVSLTLSPAMAALLLKPHVPDHEQKRGIVRHADDAGALVLPRLQLGVRTAVARLWRADGAAGAHRCDPARCLRGAAVSHVRPPCLDADGSHSAARPHVLHRRLPAAAGLDAGAVRRACCARRPTSSWRGRVSRRPCSSSASTARPSPTHPIRA